MIMTPVAMGTQVGKAMILAQRQILINQLYPLGDLATNSLFNTLRIFNNSILLSCHNEKFHANIILFH
jgi:hypothetical protein